MATHILIVSGDSSLRAACAQMQACLPAETKFVGASTGREAIQMLRNPHQPVSLVVTLLPVRFGTELLVELLRSYPGMPRLTGSRPKAADAASAKERFAAAMATVGSPVACERIGQALIDALEAQHAGEGFLQEASLMDTLMLAACDERTCSIHVRNLESGASGTLYLAGGQLVGADVEAAGCSQDAAAAARSILRWSRTDFSIHDGCSIAENRIGRTVEELLGEAAEPADGGVASVAAVELAPMVSPAPVLSPVPVKRSLREILASEYVEMKDAPVTAVAEQAPAPESVGPAPVEAAPVQQEPVVATGGNGKVKSVAQRLQQLVDFTPGPLTNRVVESGAIDQKPAVSARVLRRPDYEELVHEGLVSFRKGDYETARELWTEALRQRPDDKSLQYNLRQVEKRLVGGKI